MAVERKGNNPGDVNRPAGRREMGGYRRDGERTTYVSIDGKDVTPKVNGLLQRASREKNDGIIRQLGERLPTNITYREGHPRLSPYLGSDILRHVGDIGHTLGALNTTAIQVDTQSVIIDGREKTLHFVGATGAEVTGDTEMTKNLWIRDQAFIVGSLLRDTERRAEGKALMTSLVECMTVPSQLERFDAAIQADHELRPDEYPAIMFERKQTEKGIEVKLDTQWNHNQDAWQILANVALDAYEEGLIDEATLRKPQYQAFFSRIPAFLSQTKYLEGKNAGSWEEVSANGRLSVNAWEWPLLGKLRDHHALFGFDRETRDSMDKMIDEGAKSILHRFPHEAAAHHTPGEPAYREADIALLYLGMAKVPEKLEESGVDFRENPRIAQKMDEYGVSGVDAMYMVLFETVDTLKDPVTGGYARYLDDSYQAGRFWTPAVWGALNRDEGENEKGLWVDPDFIDGKGELHYVVRRELVNIVNDGNPGEPARWMHPNTQAATIAFRRAMQTHDARMREWYEERGTRDMRDALRMITHDNEWTIRPRGSGGVMELFQMPEGTAPECYVTDTLPDGKTVVHTGPWGPLFWTAAGLQDMMKAAAVFHEFSLKEGPREVPAQQESSKEVFLYPERSADVIGPTGETVVILNNPTDDRNSPPLLGGSSVAEASSNPNPPTQTYRV